MSYGFLAVNGNNQVLVSSDTRNLHFVGRYATPTQIIKNTNYYGGIRGLKYQVTCSVYPVPFFTMPTSDFYGLTRVSSAGPNLWDIEIFKSGDNDIYPELYIFADPRASTATDQFGMIVYRDDGTPSFDSRLRPLAIAGGLSVTQPSNPKPTFPYGLDPRYCGAPESSTGPFFAPNQFNTYLVNNIPATKPMFFYASLAQAEREAKYSDSDDDCLGSDKFGVCITRTTYDWDSSYWAFYRGAIRYVAGSNVIDAGWMVVTFGCNWSYRQDDSILGIGAGGSDVTGGVWPYSNETLNLAPSPIIFADASRYD